MGTLKIFTRYTRFTNITNIIISINSQHSSYSESFSIFISDKFPFWNKIKLSDSLEHFNMCTYFKDTSGLSTSHHPHNLNKKEKKQTNETKRHDQAVWELPTVSIDTTSIQNNTIQLYETKSMREAGLWEGRLAGGERTERWEGDKQQ
jgi:hypothetical protein